MVQKTKSRPKEERVKIHKNGYQPVDGQIKAHLDNIQRLDNVREKLHRAGNTECECVTRAQKTIANLEAQVRKLRLAQK
jgi:hypothetical protein